MQRQREKFTFIMTFMKGIVLSTLLILSHLILTTALLGNYYVQTQKDTPSTNFCTATK